MGFARLPQAGALSFDISYVILWNGMGLPARHHTKSRRNKGRAHMAWRPLGLVSCAHCGTKIMPHRVCWNCGYYKGAEIVDVLKKLDKKERKKREKVLKQQAEEAKEKNE